MILTIRLYSLIVTVNMVGFCVCLFVFHFPILLNKLVLCGLSTVIMCFCLVSCPSRGREAWPQQKEGQEEMGLRYHVAGELASLPTP